jgi:hypothetical protein
MPVSQWYKNHILFDSNSVVHRADYCAVYQGDVTEESIDSNDNEVVLEYLFEKFNIRHPKHYAGRSMSAGDIVMIDSGDSAKYYLCCFFGWHELQGF